MLSAFFHLRSTPVCCGDWGSGVARAHALALNQSLDVHLAVREFASLPGVTACQTKMLAGARCTDVRGAPQLTLLRDRALRAISNIEFVGIMDDWVRTVCLFHARFGGTLRSSESSRDQRRSHDEGLLGGFTDADDEAVFAAASARFQHDVRRTAAPVRSCIGAVRGDQVAATLNARFHGRRPSRTSSVSEALSCGVVMRAADLHEDGDGTLRTDWVSASLVSYDMREYYTRRGLPAGRIPIFQQIVPDSPAESKLVQKVVAMSVASARTGWWGYVGRPSSGSLLCAYAKDALTGVDGPAPCSKRASSADRLGALLESSFDEDRIVDGQAVWNELILKAAAFSSALDAVFVVTGAPAAERVASREAARRLRLPHLEFDAFAWSSPFRPARG